MEDDRTNKTNEQLGINRSASSSTRFYFSPKGTHMTASLSVRELRYLWTWAWLTPYRASIRKTPPTPSVQKVWRSRGSGFRLQAQSVSTV